MRLVRNLHKVHSRVLIWLPATALLSAGVLLLLGCSSRYRLELFLRHQQQMKKVDLEGTQYLRDVRIADPFQPDRLAPGSSSVAVATYGTRWNENGRVQFAVFGWDEQMRCNLLLELPQMPQPDSFDLVDRSVVQLLGHYDWSPKRRIFLPQSGYFTLDSVTSKHLFFTIEGNFQNPQGEDLQLSGRFKVRASQ